jgi:GxxExxY protein
MDVNKITGSVIGAAIDVHKELGPGLLESVYEECLCHEFALRNIQYSRQYEIPVKYKGLSLDCGYRMDLLVEDRVVVELKSVEKLMPIHDSQLLSYLKLSNCSVGLLINFNVPVLKHGVRRKVLNYAD